MSEQGWNTGGQNRWEVKAGMSDMNPGEGHVGQPGADRCGPRAGYGEEDPTQAGWGRYLVAPCPAGFLPAGVTPIAASTLLTMLEGDPAVDSLAYIRPPRSARSGTNAAPHLMCPPVAVVAMPDIRAQAMASDPRLTVEPDQPLTYTPSTAPSTSTSVWPMVDPAWAVTLEEAARVRARVMDRQGNPVPGAHVWAIGTVTTSHAVSDAEGRVSLVLPGDTPATIQALQVRPSSGYWPTRIEHPRLPETPGAEAVIEVQALSDTFEHFPDLPLTGWGTQAMRLHRVPAAYRGSGVKIALIDSGVDTTHSDLKDTVRAGYDFTAPGQSTWQNDATGHGTRCAGVIAAADNHIGITGIAPAAQLHSLKLFPNGRLSNLLQALDYCISHDLDLAQLNLAFRRPSLLTAWKLQDAASAGIAVIVPAGDTGGAVTLPAALPTVLAVGAVATTDAWPATVSPQTGRPSRSGPYAPAFTPMGPGVDLVAPGVAVITTAAHDGTCDNPYVPADGTAIAAAHITGLAALLLSHNFPAPHPRTATRVHYLHALLHAACRRVPALDPARTGAGLPDAPTALRLPEPVHPAPTDGVPGQQRLLESDAAPDDLRECLS